MSTHEDLRGGAPAAAGRSPHPAPGAGAHLSRLPVAPRRAGLLLLLSGLLGAAASLVLTVERFRLAADPSYVPSCSVDAVVSCGSVMASPQAALLGFPNPLLGLLAFPVAATLGAVLLCGAAVPRAVWLGLQAGLSAGAAFVAWLVSQALYEIGALCPYCVLVWVLVVPMFWTTTLDNLDRGRLPVPAALRPAVAALVDYRLLVVLLTEALLAGLVAARFGAHLLALPG